jgi:protein SCO1
MPQVMFISIDPATDTLDKLGNYVQSFNPRFQGATGDRKELDQLTQSVNMLYTKMKDSKTAEEAINYSRIILLIDPSGKLAAIFSSPHDPLSIARDFNVIVANSG